MAQNDKCVVLASSCFRPFYRLTLIPINVVTIHSLIIVIHSLLSVQSCEHATLWWSSSLSLDLHILDEFDCIKLYHSLSIIWLIAILLLIDSVNCLILLFIRLYRLDRELSTKRSTWSVQYNRSVPTVVLSCLSIKQRTSHKTAGST
jgi:hypothetical protein